MTLELGIGLAFLVLLFGAVGWLFNKGKAAQRGQDADKSLKGVADAQKIDRDINRADPRDLRDELRDEWTKR